jgi:hypothetical protein
MSNNATPPAKPIFLYTTAGDWQGTIIDGFIFDPRGDYIGWVQTADKTTALYTFDGEWVGDLYKDGRIVRKRAGKVRPLHDNPPKKPKAKPSNLPARAPLPPQTVELGYDSIDVLEEDPDVFKRVSERRKDLGE